MRETSEALRPGSRSRSTSSSSSERDVDHGLRVAATGQLELDGSVTAVGGLEQKTIGVRHSGIRFFLVPAGDNAAEARRYAHGVRIVPVHSFRQALHSVGNADKICCLKADFAAERISRKLLRFRLREACNHLVRA